MAEVTVIIPTRNRRHLLFRTLHSVLAQRAVSQSVVIVDDGGHDGTDKSLRALSDPRVQVVRHETRRGVSEARNTGLALAKTPWVAFVDDDDLWAPDKLPAQLGACRASTNRRHRQRRPMAFWRARDLCCGPPRHRAGSRDVRPVPEDQTARGATYQFRHVRRRPRSRRTGIRRVEQEPSAVYGTAGSGGFGW